MTLNPLQMREIFQLLFLRALARSRLQTWRPARHPDRVTLLDRIRTYAVKHNLFRGRLRLDKSWVLITALLLGMMGGGAGVAYAADGSSPGDVLYGLDTAMESLRYNLASSPETRASLALASAEERLAEVQTLVGSDASEADVQQAIEGYAFNISQAAAELAAVAASGEEARAEALAQLLQSSLSVHSQVLSEAKGRVPESAQPFFDQAIATSEVGKQTVDSIFTDGMPSGQPESIPGGHRPETPGGDASEDAPRGEGQGAARPDLASIEERLAGLDGRIAEAQDHFAAGQTAEAHGALVSYQNEIDALALDLAAAAQEDEARGQALATVLDATLLIHAEILSQLVDQVPDESMAFIEQAISASEVGRQQLEDFINRGFPSYDPPGYEAPSGRP
ncbi:MAG: hypothetical protein IIA89_15495 [Chloroflexi bacterium]|nr:hypothetical protein [Chloroflexota bacterium]